MLAYSASGHRDAAHRHVSAGGSGDRTAAMRERDSGSAGWSNTMAADVDTRRRRWFGGARPPARRQRGRVSCLSTESVFRTGTATEGSTATPSSLQQRFDEVFERGARVVGLRDAACQ